MAEYIVEFDKTQYDEMVAGGILKETDNQTLYGMLVRGEIIRCRDCDRSRERGWKCTYWATGHWDEEQEADVIELADVRPDGFCFKAERSDA